jgi:hypothetical protein
MVTPLRTRLEAAVALLMAPPAAAPVLPVRVTLVSVRFPLFVMPPVPLLIVSVDKEAV